MRTHIAVIFAVLLCCSAFLPASAATMTYYNGDYVAANVNCTGLSGGQVAWSMNTPRSPASGYTGPVFYGGVAATEAVAQWRLVDSTSQDYINTQDASAAADACIHQVVMFTNETAQAWTSVTLRVSAYSTTGANNWYRLVAQDSGGSFYISDAVSISGDTTRTDYPGSLSWYVYEPAVSVSDIGESTLWTPDSVMAVGIFQGSQRVAAGGLGSSLKQFEAYGAAASGEYTLTVYPNNAQWGGVSPTGGVYSAGSNVQISATASNHCLFANWSGSISSTNANETVTMTASKTIQANFSPVPHVLTIQSEYGSPVPSGATTNAYGSVLTNTVVSPVLSGFTQYVCIGWTLTGNSPVSGTTNSCVLTLTNTAAMLTWLWETNISTTPFIGLGPQNLSFNYGTGGAVPVPQPLVVTNLGTGTLNVSNVWNAGWLDVNPVQSGGLTHDQSASFTVSVLTNGLNPGVSNAVITVYGGAAENSPQTVAVQLTVFDGATAGDWPVYGHSNTRDFRTTETLVLPLAKAWVNKVQKPVTAHDKIGRGTDSTKTEYPIQYDKAPSLVSGGGKVYINSPTDEAVFCLDPDSGAVLWRFYAEGPVRLAPSYDSGKIYFGADDGYAYCLNASDGTLLWKKAAFTNEPKRALLAGRLGSVWPVRTGVTVENGKAYFGAGILPPQGCYLNCVDADTGDTIWRKNTGFMMQGHIVPASNELYVGTGRTAPMEYNKTNGVPRYALAAGDVRREGGGVEMSLLGDMLVYGRNENGVTQIRITTNALSAYAVANAARRIPGEIVYVSARRVLADDDRFYFLHTEDRSGYLSQFLKPESVLAVPQTSATNIFFQAGTDMDARIPRVTAEGLSIYWHYGSTKIGPIMGDPKMTVDLISNATWQVTNNPCIFSALLTPNALYAGGSNSLAAYSLTDGAVLWSSTVTGVVYELSLANGALYAGTDAGYTYCFKNGAGGSVDESPLSFTSPYPTNDSLYGKYVEAAELAIANAGVNNGFCLVLGAGEGRLAYEIAKRSDFFVVGLETDSARAAVARSNLTAAGVYGSRVVIHEDMDELFPHPDYFADLIVSEELLISGSMPYSSREIFRMARPYRGTVLFGNKDGNLDLTSWVGDDISAWSTVASAQGITWKMARRGARSGFGDWGFQLGDPGNSLSSGDTLVKSNLRLQWTGDLNPETIADRHNIPGSPLVANGRLFIVGLDYITAADIYSGRMLWDRPMKNVLRQIAPLDALSACAVGDRLYVASSNTCRVLNAQDGTDLAAFQGPLSAYDWGYVGVYSNILFGSNQKVGASVTTAGKVTNLYIAGAGGTFPVVSYNLFARNPTNGTTLWNYTNGVILNSTITLGGTNVFFMESRNATAVNDADGRVTVPDFLATDAWMVALDMQTGQKVWEQSVGRVNETKPEQACYLSHKNGRLVTTITYWGLDGPSGAVYVMRLLDAADGTQIGSTKIYPGGSGGNNTTDHNGALMRPFLTMGKAFIRLYTSRTIQAIDLNTASTNVVTIVGGSTAKKGCTPPAASYDTIYYRGYDIEGTSLTNGRSTLLTTVTRPSCWPSLIPACGMLVMSEGSAGCNCGMALQTSIAMAPVIDDTDAPNLFNVVALDENTVVAVFDEAVDKAAAENKDNYSLSNGITVSGAVRQTNHLERVTLTVSTMASGTNTLTVSGLKDLYGNMMGSQQMDFESGAADTDSDGLPDSWEQQYFSNPTNAVPSVDSDGDGLTNWQEYIAGTDPTNAFSSLRVENIIPVAGNGYVVTWTPQSGRTYNVRWTANLTNSFQTLETGIAYPQASWTDTLHGASAEGFYRIEATK